MIAPTEPDDVAVPPALAAALRRAAATVPPAHPDHDLGAVRRRAAGHRRRRRAVTGVAAATALLLGGLGGHRMVTAGEDGAVVVPASVSGWQRTGQDVTLLVPTSMPDGWTLAGLDTGASGDLPAGPTTSQLFAADGRPPSGRGVVVTSWAAGPGDGVDGTHTVRGEPAHVERWDGWGPLETLEASWVEDGVRHDVTALGLTEAELTRFLGSLVPEDDPATGFTAPPGDPLTEVDTVTGTDPSASGVWYRGPGGEVISVSATSPGAGTLIGRLGGEPDGNDLVSREPGGDHPNVTVTRADGWAVSALVERGTVDPALLEAVARGVERSTVGELVDSGRAGPVTALASVGGTTVEVHGTGAADGSDALDLAVCLTPGSDRPACVGVADHPHAGFTSASLVVDGDWTVVTVTDGDEPGVVLAEPEGGWRAVAGEDPGDGGDPLDGERERAEGRWVEVVTVPDGVDHVIAQSPATDAGSSGLGYVRPGR